MTAAINVLEQKIQYLDETICHALKARHNHLQMGKHYHQGSGFPPRPKRRGFQPKNQMKSLMEEIAAIESRAAKLDLPMSFICKWAGVSQATWSRWKKEAFGPTKKNWDKIADAVADLERRLKR